MGEYVKLDLVDADRHAVDQHMTHAARLLGRAGFQTNLSDFVAQKM